MDNESFGYSRAEIEECASVNGGVCLAYGLTKVMRPRVKQMAEAQAARSWNQAGSVREWTRGPMADRPGTHR